MEFNIKGKNNLSIVIYDGNTSIYYHSGCSNNKLEWLSFIEALKIFENSKKIGEKCIIYTDSKVLFKQLNWEYKKKKLKEYYLEYNMLKNKLSGCEIICKFVSGYENPARLELEKRLKCLEE